MAKDEKMALRHSVIEVGDPMPPPDRVLHVQARVHGYGLDVWWYGFEGEFA